MSLDGFVVVTGLNCPWCEKAKDLLRQVDPSFLTFSVEVFPVMRDFLKGQGLRTVPQVYHGGERVGGYEELVAYLVERRRLVGGADLPEGEVQAGADADDDQA